MRKIIAAVLAVGTAICCDVALARYIEADPVGVVPGTPLVAVPSAVRAVTASDVLRANQLNHSYAYVSSSPLRYTDPLGLEPVGSIPSDPNQAAVFYNWPSRMRPASGGCVLDCMLKRQVACIPMRAAGMLGGLSVAAVGSFPTAGADFPVLAPPAVFIGGNTGAAICSVYFFQNSCEEECKSKSCKPQW